MRRIVLLLTLGTVGCGGGSTAPTSSPTVTPSPPAVTPATKPAAPADPYQLDPAKHFPPVTPVAGRVNGKAVTPDAVELLGTQLTFRAGKDFFPDAQVQINLTDAPPRDTATMLVVKPTDQWPDSKVSNVSVSVRGAGDGPPDTTFVNDGFALTLTLDPVKDGKVTGKIQLALPGNAKSYMAGTFTATRLRGLDEPLSADDAPFVRGTIAHPPTEGKMLSAGYVDLSSNDEAVTDSVGLQLPAPGESGGWVQSTTFRPRTAAIIHKPEATRYEFAKLPPGVYLLHARIKGGPITWAKVEVKAGDQLTRDLKVEAGKGGTVEVTTSADFTGEVQLVPIDLLPKEDADFVAGRIATRLELGAKADGGKATVQDVPPGKYTIYTTPGTLKSRGTVEVTAGKTATVTIKTDE